MLSLNCLSMPSRTSRRRACALSRRRMGWGLAHTVAAAAAGFVPEEDDACQGAGRRSSDHKGNDKQAGKGSHLPQGNDKIAAVRGQMRCAAGALVFGPLPGHQACCCDLLPSGALVGCGSQR